MAMYSVQVLNPKAIRLLEDLADLELIKLQPKTPLAAQPTLTEEERNAARKRVMQGAPTLNVDEMIEWLNESRKDRKLPFRDEE